MSTGKRILFFATKKDMINVFCSTKYSFRFIKAGNHPIDDLIVYESIENIPNLGYLQHSSHCMLNYLILYEGEKINSEKINLSSGESIQAIYQNLNVNSVVLSPSGFCEDEKCLIHGQLSTNSNSDVSKDLFTLFKKNIRKQFVHHNGWYIGEEAMKFYGKVRFITIGTGSPPEYDFKF